MSAGSVTTYIRRPNSFALPNSTPMSRSSPIRQVTVSSRTRGASCRSQLQASPGRLGLGRASIILPETRSIPQMTSGIEWPWPCPNVRMPPPPPAYNRSIARTFWGVVVGVENLRICRSPLHMPPGSDATSYTTNIAGPHHSVRV